MTHLWLRAEQRAHEQRVGLSHQGAKMLVDAGVQLSVEKSSVRAIETQGYEIAGAQIVAEHSWPQAPDDAIIFGLKELPEDGSPLKHRHIMFGHSYKGQFSGQQLLRRFKDGGGTLYDLEYLIDKGGRRVAAFGYWAGYAGASVSLKAWAAQKKGNVCPPVGAYRDKHQLLVELSTEIRSLNTQTPTAIVIGALGRVGTGVTDLCHALGISVTAWDIAETAHGGPFPEILEHDIFFNCILANDGVPPFVQTSVKSANRCLSVIGDIACDPDSEYNPVPVYDRVTNWNEPVLRVHDNPVLDVMAIDNLPSMLPRESSEDFANQLLPSLMALDNMNAGVWARAKAIFDQHIQDSVEE